MSLSCIANDVHVYIALIMQVLQAITTQKMTEKFISDQTTCTSEDYISFLTVAPPHCFSLDL